MPGHPTRATGSSGALHIEVGKELEGKGTSISSFACQIMQNPCHKKGFSNLIVKLREWMSGLK